MTGVTRPGATGQKEEKKEKEKEEKEKFLRAGGPTKVVQEVLADLKSLRLHILKGFLKIKQLC